MINTSLMILHFGSPHIYIYIYFIYTLILWSYFKILTNFKLVLPMKVKFILIMIFLIYHILNKILYKVCSTIILILYLGNIVDTFAR